MKPKLTLSQVQLAMLSQAPDDAPRMPAFMNRKPVIRSKTRNAHPEADIQAAVVIWLGMQYPRILVSASLSGTRLAGGMLAMIRAKKLGMLPGLPDLCLICPAGKVIWMEVKSEKGVLSEAQKYVHGKLGGLGHSVFVIRSLADAQEIMKMENIA